MFDLKADNYSYLLPKEKIAQFPSVERDKSKLLVYKNGCLGQCTFGEISEHLHPGHLLVYNNSRVIRARLLFRKETGSTVEIFLLEPLSPKKYGPALRSDGNTVWSCLVGNRKKLKGGIISDTFNCRELKVRLKAEIISGNDDAVSVRFTWDIPGISFWDIIESAGHVPLPPYIQRQDNVNDSTGYQTIYSSTPGSVAAPTAGLHFTHALIDRIRNKGIKTTEITLHVGAGTFQPLKSLNISEHEMHREHFEVNAATIEMLIKHEGKVIAVGTTSVRTIESLYWMGVRVKSNPGIEEDRLFTDQWEPYSVQASLTSKDALSELLKWMKLCGIQTLSSSTRIMIVPGYEFRICSGIITNFHLPGSTLILLVAAFTGDAWRKIYDYALDNDFRFLSYGDASLLLK